MPEIDYKKKLKIMKKISDIHLMKKHLEMLYWIATETGKKRQYKSFLSESNQDTLIILEDLSNIGLVEMIDSHSGFMKKFRISTSGLQLIVKIRDEENKGHREKLLPRANKQSPLRPFISILIAVGALVVAIAG